MTADTIPTLYKIVGPAGEPLNGGSGVWPLPTDTAPGDWRTIDGPLEACRNGLHLTDAAHLSQWLPRQGDAFIVYRAEVAGECFDAGQKWVAGKVRLLPRSEPMPDLQGASEVLQADLDAAREPLRKATARRDARIARAKRKARKAAGAWLDYMLAIGRHTDVTMPAGAPEAAATLAAETAAADAALRKARAKYQRAADAAEAAYAATLAGLAEGA